MSYFLFQSCPIPHRNNYALLFVLATIGCGPKGCDTSGLEQLTQSTPRNVYFPGQRLAAVAGNEVPVKLLGAKGIPTAVVTRDAVGRLHAYPFDGTKGCVTAALAPEDEPSAGNVDDPIENILPYVSKVDGSTTSLTFMDKHCEAIVEPFANATLVGHPAGYDHERFVILTEDERLIELHPETRETTNIATQVSAASLTDQYLVTLEQGTVTLRNHKLERIDRFGTNVTEMRVDGANARVAFVDDDGLRYLDTDALKAEWVDDAACYVSWADAPAEALALVYEQSCEDNTLVVNLPEAGLRATLPTGAQKPVALRNFGTKQDPNWYVSFFTDVTVAQAATDVSSALSVGTRYLGPFGKTAAAIGQARTANSLTTVESGKVLLWLAPDTDESRLVSWSPKAQADYQQNVSAFALSPDRALVTDQQSSRLVQVAATEHPITLLEDASGTGTKTNHGTFLFSNVTDDTGQIHFLAAEETTPEALFDNALSTSAQLFWEGSTAAALESYSTKQQTGTLSVRILDTADTFSQPNVRSFAPTTRPAQGIAYIAKTSSGYDLYWAAAE